MTTAVLDEEGIILLLRTPVTTETTGALQAGAVQALVDLYDRKVTREVFCENASVCISLYNEAGKLWMLNNIHEVFVSDAGLTEDRFVVAREKLAELIRRQAEALIDIVQRLRLCPTDKDKVH